MVDRDPTFDNNPPTLSEETFDALMSANLIYPQGIIGLYPHIGAALFKDTETLEKEMNAELSDEQLQTLTKAAIAAHEKKGREAASINEARVKRLWNDLRRGTLQTASNYMHLVSGEKIVDSFVMVDDGYKDLRKYQAEIESFLRESPDLLEEVENFFLLWKEALATQGEAASRRRTIFDLKVGGLSAEERRKNAAKTYREIRNGVWSYLKAHAEEYALSINFEDVNVQRNLGFLDRDESPY